MFNKVKTFFIEVKDILKLLIMSSKTNTLLLIITNIIGGLMIPLGIMVWKYFIDSVVASITTKVILTPVLILIIHYAVEGINNFIMHIEEYFEQMEFDYVNKYVTSLTINKTAKLEMRHFDKKENYDMIQKVNMESTQRLINILNMTMLFIRNVVTLAGIIGVLFLLNGWVILFCIIVSIPTAVVSFKMSGKQYKIFNGRIEDLRKIAEVKNILTDYENIKELKIYRLGKFLEEYTLKLNNKFIGQNKSVRKKFVKDISLSETLQLTILYLLKLYVVFKVIYSNMSIGDLTVFVSAIDNFYNCISSMFRAIIKLYENGLYIKDLNYFLSIPIQEDDTGLAFNKNYAKIEFNHVYFRYSDSEEYVLEDISFCIENRKSYAFVGINGAGKTTMVKLLLRLYEPTKGNITIDGVDIKDISIADYWENIGVVFQEFIQYPFDVKHNIGFGCVEKMSDIELIKNAAKKGGAYDFIEKLKYGFDTNLKKGWDESIQLSLGQWQKIAISRAFMQEFPILILDEPTASVDAKTEYELYNKLKTLITNRTCILISHRFSTVKLVDTIFVIENHKLVEKGSHQELLGKKGVYATLYNMQAEAYEDDYEG